MRKILKYMFAIAFFCSISIETLAQEFTPKHEFAISYGAAPTTTWAKLGEAVISAAVSGLFGGNYKYEDTSWFGPISGEYFYHLSPAFSVGAIVCFSQDNDDILYKKEKIGDRTTTFWTAMPALKWDYVRSKNFGMYMKLAAGYTLQQNCEKYTDQSDQTTKEETSTSGMINIQASLLGMEVGSSSIRGFFELGFGEQGIVLAGLRCKLP